LIIQDVIRLGIYLEKYVQLRKIAFCAVVRSMINVTNKGVSPGGGGNAVDKRSDAGEDGGRYGSATTD
jgi:hypothetical protein